MLYEHPDVFEGSGHIVYTDRTVEMIDEPEFTAIIDNLQNPDGTPFAPHRP